VPFREPELPLQDILKSIDSIIEFVRGMDLEAFRADPKTIAAVERKLLLISEAAVRLGGEADRLCPGLPWHKTVVDDLPPLKSAVLRALDGPPGTVGRGEIEA
jgi:uncharacterized protein with HEPN domain